MSRAIQPLFVVLLSLAILTMTPARTAQAGGGEPTTAYVNASWWTGRNFVRGSRFVRDGRFIQATGPADRVEDLHGAYVVPPFADAHNHMAGTPSDFSDKAIAAGVFYVMNPTILASIVPATRQALTGPGKVDAIYSMGAITAPGGHPVGLYQDILRPYIYKTMKPEDFAGDAYHEVASAADIEPALDRLVSQHADFVKIVLMFSEEFERRRDDPAFREKRGLDPKLVPLIVQAAHRRGLRVAAHIETAADFRVIVAAGVDESAHMPGYYGGEGPVSQYAIIDADARAAARAHIHLVATASYALNNPDKSNLPAIQAMQRANLLKLKRAGVPILIGTDRAGSDAPGEADYLVKLGVLTPREALVSLSEATPSFIFPARKLGRLAPGYEARFLVLGADPTKRFDAVKLIKRRVKQGFEIPERP